MKKKNELEPVSNEVGLDETLFDEADSKKVAAEEAVVPEVVLLNKKTFWQRFVKKSIYK